MTVYIIDGYLFYSLESARKFFIAKAKEQA